MTTYAILALLLLAATQHPSLAQGDAVSLSHNTAALSDTAAKRSFGAPLTLDPATAITVSAAMQDTAKFGQTVLVHGTITDVCMKKGCWLVVTDQAGTMRVTFKDYGFFVPKNVHNRTVYLQGVVKREVIEEDLAKHYAEESNKGPKPEEITGPQTVITMVADGVVIVE
ncbi:MAG: DUF4920 domain-containing protein [Chlorobi bacterium]|nr:MAG: hypothetical protein UZ07_CHB004000925 [Chlorobi bacterium OLB7]MBK8910342.1 DUF4920 domain-containing protein [Chlorobiota bacterium]MBX7217254.1 DUF4920 domain-containing protein [Candidatus Kapabacteria bacterium]